MTRWIVAGLIAVTAACGGGGSPVVVIPAISAAFTAIPSIPGPNSAAMAPGPSQTDSVAVLVKIETVTGLRSAEFDVLFDSAALDFLTWAPGDALELSGQTPLYVAEANTPGVLTVGVNLTGTVSVDINGSFTLIALVFRVKQTGSFPLQFQSEALRDVNLQVIGVNWFAGMLTGS